MRVLKLQSECLHRTSGHNGDMQPWEVMQEAPNLSHIRYREGRYPKMSSRQYPPLSQP